MKPIRIAAWLLAALVVGCGTPSTVAPTLTDLNELGFRCGSGTKGSEPNNLYQWLCRSPVDADPERGVYVEGNDRGVSSIILFVSSGDPRDAKAAFADLLHGVRLLSTVPELGAPVERWGGPQEWWDIRGVRLSAECDPDECRIEVAPVAGPLVPLPLSQAVIT
jgi:hypothetical protein